PFLERHLLEIPKETDSRVVDENVQASERAFRLGEERRNLVLTAHIARTRENAPRIPPLQFLRRGCDLVGVPSGDRHPGSRLQQPFRDGPADPLRAARHDRGLIPGSTPVHRISSSACLSSASFPVKKWSAPLMIFTVTLPVRSHFRVSSASAAGLPYWSRSPWTIASGQGTRSRKSNARSSAASPSAMKRSTSGSPSAH